MTLNRILPSISGVTRPLLQVLLPHRCALCDAASMGDSGLCGLCFGRLDFVGETACPGCARPLHDTTAGRAAPFCGTCLRDGPMFDHAVSALNYNAAAAQIILQLKHGDRMDLSPLLAKWLAMAWKNSGAPEIDLIVPVPLHKWRFLTRRYNQSLELSRSLPRVIGGRLVPNVLVRRKNTPQMREMNREQRRRNVAGAFAIRQAASGKQGNLLQGKHVLLVDDVYTTGATLRAVAGTLRRAHVASVSVLVVARVTRADQ